MLQADFPERTRSLRPKNHETGRGGAPELNATTPQATRITRVPRSLPLLLLVPVQHLLLPPPSLPGQVVRLLRVRCSRRVDCCIALVFRRSRLLYLRALFSIYNGGTWHVHQDVLVFLLQEVDCYIWLCWGDYQLWLPSSKTAAVGDGHRSELAAVQMSGSVGASTGRWSLRLAATLACTHASVAAARDTLPKRCETRSPRLVSYRQGSLLFGSIG